MSSPPARHPSHRAHAIHRIDATVITPSSAPGKPAVTRFPPSPTGDLHIGGARTALFNWLYAKKTGGELVLRIEDTDRQRSTDEAVNVILEALKWLGLDWDRGPFYQSKRFDRYGEVIRQLLDAGNAYHCFCSKEKLTAAREAQRAARGKPRYDRHCRELGRRPTGGGESAVVRFKNPLRGAVVFDDLVRGKVTIDNAELDDLIIARSDGAPTYNLTVVVDDMDMGVTHVIRGDDHTNNTPRQINIFQALGASLPVFAHLPLISGADGRRLSKRDGAAGVLEYRAMGILPEALLNYLVRLGWSHGDREIFSLEEMVELFDLQNINPSAAAFDLAKLLSVNQHYLRQASPRRLAAELEARLKRRGIETGTDTDTGPPFAEVAEVMAARVQTLEEMADKVIYLYADFAEYEPDAAKKHLDADAAKLLRVLHDAFERVDDWREPAINAALAGVLEAQSVKLGKIAQPLRVAISGGAATPPIDITLQLVGRKRTLERIQKALRWIAARR